MSQNEKFTLCFADPGGAMGVSGPVLACVLRELVTVPLLKSLRRETEKVVARLGTQRVGITIVEAQAVGDVPKEVREESAGLMRDFPSLSSVTVIEGGGFKAIAARAILASITLLSKTRDQNRVFRSIDEAAEWVLPKVPKDEAGMAVTKERMIELVEWTRARIPKR